MSTITTLYGREPARINSALAGLIVALLLKFGVHVQDQDAVALVALIVPVLLGELTRAKVTPSKRLKAIELVAGKLEHGPAHPAVLQLLDHAEDIKALIEHVSAQVNQHAASTAPKPYWNVLASTLGQPTGAVAATDPATAPEPAPTPVDPPAAEQPANQEPPTSPPA